MPQTLPQTPDMSPEALHALLNQIRVNRYGLRPAPDLSDDREARRIETGVVSSVLSGRRAQAGTA